MDKLLTCGDRLSSGGYFTVVVIEPVTTFFSWVSKALAFQRRIDLVCPDLNDYTLPSAFKWKRNEMGIEARKQFHVHRCRRLTRTATFDSRVRSTACRTQYLALLLQ